MKRKLFTAALAVLCCLFLAGCWNYRGLNDMDIVTGIAIDRNMETGMYHLTFEIADMQSAGGDGKMEAKYVESEGKTFFEAIRNAKKRLINKLYGGNLQTLVVSNEIARRDGVSSVIEELLRDGDPRETLSVVISQEKTAAEILLTDGMDSNIIAYEIHGMIREDNQVTASTKNLPMYKAYGAIKGEGSALVLPAVRSVSNNEKTVAEVNGIALFDHDRLIGYQSAENTIYYLFVVDEVESGVLSFPIAEDRDESISLEIKSSQTNTTAAYENDQLRFDLDIRVALNLTEAKGQIDISQGSQKEQLEARTQQVLYQRITAFLQEIQQNLGIDIFGLGKLLYQKNPDLWRLVKDDWQTLFQNAAFTVNVTAEVISAGVLKCY